MPYLNPDFENSVHRKPPASPEVQASQLDNLTMILAGATDNWVILILPKGKLYLAEVEGDCWNT